MNKKIKRAFFIGSGPSCGIGLPSITELLELALNAPQDFANRKTEDENSFFFRVKTDKLAALKFILSKYFPNVPLNKINFEEVLTVFDESNIGPEIVRFPSQFSGDDNLSDLKHLLISAGMRVLWDRVNRTRLEKNRKFESWKLFFSKINTPESKFEDLVVTTNYDTIIEMSIKDKYMYSNIVPGMTSILKLHGSMNWYQLMPGRYATSARGGIVVPPGYESEELLDYVENRRLVAGPPDFIPNEYPVIITPQLSKVYSDSLFKRIWWLASNVLQSVEELVIFGYSFSGNDFYVKRLIDVAINTEFSKIKKIIHFDRNSDLKKLFVGDEKNKNGTFFVRNKNVEYSFREIDFSDNCPDFENLSGPLLKLSD